MQLDYYQIDAFADEVFKGNPAGVIPLYEWLSDETLQNLAMENGQSETAFFVKKGEYFELRWFTPEAEVDLCGHATLAAAFVLHEFLGYKDPAVVFATKSGRIFVDREDGIYSLDLPTWTPREMQVSERVTKALGVRPDALFVNDRDMMAVFEDPQAIRDMVPDMRQVSQLDGMCMIVTAPSLDYDFISRVFVPEAGIGEDPVTGSAHCALIPYWAERLGKSTLTAYQASARGGVLDCEHLGGRVKIAGQAICYMQGLITL